MQITAKLPFATEAVRELKIVQRLNTHGIAYLSGMLSNDSMEAINDLTEKTPVDIKISNPEGNKHTVFYGTPCSMKTKHRNGVIEYFLLLKDSSIFLDLQKNFKSFQDKNNTYKNIFDTILSSYHGSCVDTVSNNKPLNQPLIQYEETDWEFLIRTASILGAAIYSNPLSNKPGICLGVPKGNSYQEPKIAKQSYKDDHNRISCRFESYEDYQIGDTITDGSFSLTITEKVIRLRKGLLSYSYVGQDSEAMTQKPKKNSRLKGSSIEGKVIAVKEDLLKVKLSIDSHQSKSEACLFPLATPYAAEGSAGFYAIPQVGESINLYFPSFEEKDAIVWYTNRLDSNDNPNVSRPSIKRFGTEDGKELKMSPNQLSFSASKNKLLLSLDQKNGILLKSRKDIHLKTPKNLLSRCHTLEMESQDKIILSTLTSSIVVDDIVHIKG
jgi:hypothetical protein